jgi:hypothetical protein
VPIILNKSLKAILLTIPPSQINHPIGATAPANISITPVGTIGIFIGSNELPFGELVGIALYEKDPANFHLYFNNKINTY